jgi:hypothetical protein
MKLSALLFLALVALPFGATPAAANDFREVRKIILDAHLIPWDNTPEAADETNKLWKCHPDPQPQLIQNLALEYVNDNLRPELRKCIEATAPTHDKVLDYYIGEASNLIMTVEYDVNAAKVDDKDITLASLYLQLLRPNSYHGDGAIYGMGTTQT